MLSSAPNARASILHAFRTQFKTFFAALQKRTAHLAVAFGMYPEPPQTFGDRVYCKNLFLSRKQPAVEAYSIEDIRALFKDDQFATKCLGATIDAFDFETSTATVSMTLDDRHHNAQGFVMGGVFFSLADFALAVASNVNQPPSASTNVSIEHLRRAKGNKLIAIAHPDKLGRTLAFFTINVFDELNTHVARAVATVMRTDH